MKIGFLTRKCRGESRTRVVGWGPFPLPGEQRRRRAAHEQAVAELLRAQSIATTPGTDAAS